MLTHHHWSKALEAGRQVDAVFLDLGKTFDKVSHVILLQKFSNFGVSHSGYLLNWWSDYLSNRGQRVVIDGISSY